MSRLLILYSRSTPVLVIKCIRSLSLVLFFNDALNLISILDLNRSEHIAKPSFIFLPLLHLDLFILAWFCAYLCWRRSFDCIMSKDSSTIQEVTGSQLDSWASDLQPCMLSESGKSWICWRKGEKNRWVSPAVNNGELLRPIDCQSGAIYRRLDVASCIPTARDYWLVEQLCPLSVGPYIVWELGRSWLGSTSVQ